MLAALKVTEQNDRRLINESSMAIGTVPITGIAPTFYDVNLANNFMTQGRAKSSRRCFARAPVGSLRRHEFVNPSFVGIRPTVAIRHPGLFNGAIHVVLSLL
jgi:hypothetical protein